MMDHDFEQFLKRHEQRIHFQIHRLNISKNDYDEFYAEGLLALWQAYQNFEPSRGKIGTYLNYRIRYRLIDLLREKSRIEERTEQILQASKIRLNDGHRHKTAKVPLVDPKGLPLSTDDFWQEVRRHLTERQWKWIKYFIIADLTIKEIMEIESVSADAVKSWGREARRKLRNPDIQQKLQKLL